MELQRIQQQPSSAKYASSICGLGLCRYMNWTAQLKMAMVAVTSQAIYLFHTQYKMFPNWQMLQDGVLS